MVVACGHGDHLVEMLTLDPELILSGLVSGILAAFEHGDDHYLDGNRLGSGGKTRAQQSRNQALRQVHGDLTIIAEMQRLGLVDGGRIGACASRFTRRPTTLVVVIG